MTEPRMISIDQAKLLMSVIDPDQPPIRKDWDDHLVHKLAATVVENAEQIKRLQAAVKELSREMEGYRPHEVAWVELTHDDILRFEDMEDTDD